MKQGWPRCYSTSSSFDASLDVDKVRQQFGKEGYAIVPDLFSAEAVERLRERAVKLVDEWTPSEKEFSVFQTSLSQVETTDEYFLNSGSRISFFLEKDVLSPDRRFLFPKARCINKIGHALHELDPTFRAFSHSRPMRQLAQAAGLSDPLLVQSMYIFKQPRVGGDVTPHQDNSFVITEPSSCVGIWVALEKATRDNGCLWAIPGSHTVPVSTYFVRDPSRPDSKVLFDPVPDVEPAARWPAGQFSPLEVDVGTVIMLHGNLVHRSYSNLSADSRHAFTLHLVDATARYSPRNWLQRPVEMPFQGFASQS